MFRGYDAERERLVAIKLFTLDLPPERVHELVARFERLVAADLTHPAIAAPLATGIEDVSAYLVHECVAAESLDLAVREGGPTSPARAVRVAAQLAGALDFAASAAVDHGALHLRDVLLSGDETRVTGFGVARALEAGGIAAPIRRPYTAPERFGGGKWDRRADVFSLAALVYELLWGRRVAGTGHQAVASLDGADPAALGAVFARALAGNPAERYGTALAFAEALAGAFSGVMTKSSLTSLHSSVGSHQSSVADSQPERLRPATEDGAPSAEDRPENRRLAPEEWGLKIEALPLPLGGPEADLEVRRASEDALDGVQVRNPVAPAFDIDAVFKTLPPQPDLDLSAAEPRHGEDVEVAPALMGNARPVSGPGARDLGPDDPGARCAARDKYRAPSLQRPAPGAASLSRIGPIPEPEPLTALERSRSAVWPLLLALGVGLAMGFAGGYGVGVHDRALSLPAGRESTESAGAEPPESARTDAGELRLSPSPDASALRGRLGGAGRPEHAAAPATPPTRSRAGVPLRPDSPAIGTTKTATGATATMVQPGDAPQSRDAGRLLVRSTPAGARVLVDGRDVGVTPAAVGDLARGVHHVRVSRDGYLTQERRVVITARRRPAITLQLARTTVTSTQVSGDLNVESRPSGAKVYLDGKLVGATPLAIPSVAAGEHDVRIERDGYRRWSSSVRVVANERSRVTASLER